MAIVINDLAILDLKYGTIDVADLLLQKATMR
jgi:hypothetical protein